MLRLVHGGEVLLASASALLLAVVVVGGFFFAARKDGEYDRSLQRRLGVRWRTRL